jgi:hypothetical protein
MNETKRDKNKKKLTISFIMTMMIVLAVMTSASISAYEWMQSYCLSHVYLKGVTIDGNDWIDSSDILEASGLNLDNDNIHSVVSHVIEKRIKVQFPYLKSVDISRKFNFKVGEGFYGWLDIKVNERKPVALVLHERDNSYMVVDDDGFILEKLRYENLLYPYSCMPVISGVDLESLGDMNPGLMNRPGFSLALEVLNSIRRSLPHLYEGVVCMDVRNPDKISVYLESDNFLPRRTCILISSDLIQEGLDNVSRVVDRCRQEDRQINYMDARFSGVVYCSNRDELLI